MEGTIPRILPEDLNWKAIEQSDASTNRWDPVTATAVQTLLVVSDQRPGLPKTPNRVDNQEIHLACPCWNTMPSKETKIYDSAY